MSIRNARGLDLREACIEEAMAIIEAEGIEGLSLREISRRLGVSHQAPYKHFPSRDHVLAEIVSRAFDSFAQHLDAHAQVHTDDPQADLGRMGRAYMSYAMAHPLQYRLMFGTPLPDPQAHPTMMGKAQHAFALLKDCILRLSLQREGDPDQATDLDALFVWSTMHGLASMLHTRALDTLGLPSTVLASASDYLMIQIGAALGLKKDGSSRALID